ncbi:hypothetical protein LINPERPRIM_LOCUS4799, partial [Linum perenne]
MNALDPRKQTHKNPQPPWKHRFRSRRRRNSESLKNQKPFSDEVAVILEGKLGVCAKIGFGG